MKRNRQSLFALVFALSFICISIHAQNPQQIKILNNYDAIPFEDGKTIIAEVSYSGFKYESDVMKLLRDYRNEIKVGDTFKGSRISQAVKIIREWLESEGYQNAELNAFGEQLPNNQIKLIFATKLGDLAKVSEIRFEGNVNVSNAELVTDAKRCIGDGWETFSTRKYTYIANKCSHDLMSSKGYFRARTFNIVRKPITNGNVVIIEVDEGVRFRLGEISIEGLSMFSKEQFLEMLGQKSGDIANGKIIREFLYDKLSVAYKNKGYLQYDAEIDPEFINPKNVGQDGLINLKIIIDEGRQFRIRKIEIVCPDLMKIQKIRKTLGLKEGEIFNQSKFEEGIKRINNTKDFLFVDKDKDVEIQTHLELPEIYLVVKVKSKWMKNLF